MKKSLMEGIKEKLLQRRREIAGYVEDGASRKVGEAGAKDVGDEALEMSMERLESSILTTEIDELRLIEEALLRIANGTYGLCIDCQNQISESRLENFPYAARCIVCQERFES
jgi:DnaK suppressor protein